MVSRFRLLSIVALGLVFMGLPGGGLAAAQVSGGATQPSTGPISQAAVPATAAFTAVPGATIKTIGATDLVSWPNSGVGQIAGSAQSTAGQFYYYDTSSGTNIVAAVDLPAGATIWQIDCYGYRVTVGTQLWQLDDMDATLEALSNNYVASTPSGSGLVHATLSFAGGVTLASGHEWDVVLPSSSTNSGFVGAVVQYTLPTLSFIPITPVRVFDSRFSRFGGPIVQGTPRTINVKDAIDITSGAVTSSNAIPVGAKAVAFNVTATDTVNPGYIAVLPGTSTTLTVSTVNWTANAATVANGGVVALGSGSAERQITLVVGGPGSTSTDAVVDITGYYE
jgi:hypothetical protein